MKPRGAIFDTAARCTCAATPGRLCETCTRLGNLGWPIAAAGTGQDVAQVRGEQHRADSECAGQAEGAAYARALLDRIGAGTSTPDDLAGLLQFMGRGALLHGFAAVIFEALRRAATQQPAR